MERFRSKIDPACMEYSMYPIKQRDGGRLQQRAEYALGKLGRDQISQSFGPNSIGPGERPCMRQSQQRWSPVWPQSGESGTVDSYYFFDLRWLRDEHMMLEALEGVETHGVRRHQGVKSHWRAPVRWFQMLQRSRILSGRYLLSFSTNQCKRVY